MSTIIITVILLALIFDFLNGIHDSSNIVATMISSRTLPPRIALWMTALAEFFGPLIFGVAVANTIGHEVVDSNVISLQVILTALVQALSHGANDAQKTMCTITLALVTGGYLSKFSVPIWVILLSGAMIALGTSVGGWRLIRTLGGKFYRIRPVDGFASQVASAVVILTASLVGGPVITTHDHETRLFESPSLFRGRFAS